MGIRYTDLFCRTQEVSPPFNFMTETDLIPDTLYCFWNNNQWEKFRNQETLSTCSCSRQYLIFFVCFAEIKNP